MVIGSIASLIRLSALVCGFSAILFGQAAVNRFPGQWVGDLFIVENKMTQTRVYLIDENNVVKNEILSVTTDQDFPVPQEIRAGKSSSAWYEDGLHTLTFSRGVRLVNTDGTPYRSFTFAKWQDGEWHHLGSYNTLHTNLMGQAIPCANDRFIFVTNADIAGNTGSSSTPFARMHLNRDRKSLSVQASIDHGQDDLRVYVADDFSILDAWRSSLVMTDSHATLINEKTGLYWIFSLESASLRKAGNIFRSVKPEWVAKSGLNAAVLCVHPEKDGTILISAQMESQLINQERVDIEMKELAEKLRVGDTGSTMTYQEWLELYFERQAQVKQQNPWVEWYRIYPEEGRVEKIMVPEGGLLERRVGATDLWRPMPDGSVQMGDVRFNNPGTVKKGQEPEKEAVTVK